MTEFSGNFCGDFCCAELGADFCSEFGEFVDFLRPCIL